MVWSPIPAFCLPKVTPLLVPVCMSACLSAPTHPRLRPPSCVCTYVCLCIQCQVQTDITSRLSLSPAPFLARPMPSLCFYCERYGHQFCSIYNSVFLWQKRSNEEDESEIRFLIHQSQAGAIIGRGGNKVKEMREVHRSLLFVSLLVFSTSLSDVAIAAASLSCCDLVMFFDW